ncbi:PREDICTED: uncharacterized protein LOC106745118 [Dinoponera quadriceps]|uniref:Uncharacterized protein LOC106745118 n=1 Tax=Dinoponera quadriceps TaxID=609295 RepID=A0A6P3XDF2_DINQU|nr:PREDICTED: uncharacterized protein LOC106745118 [Dinoponera quadriceps]
MFYPAYLLSHPSKGKLTPCWLAATCSEKSFKKHYNFAAIKKINIIMTWYIIYKVYIVSEEILRAVQLRSSKTKRFSLYLSSQLMYGVTRIFSYQIIYYQSGFNIYFNISLCLKLFNINI